MNTSVVFDSVVSYFINIFFVSLQIVVSNLF